MAFGSLHALRKERNLTQEQLSVELQVSRQAITSYETGERTPPPKVAGRIAKFFGISLEDVWAMFYDDKQGDHSNEPNANAS